MKKRALIIGMGISGQSCAKWLHSIGYELVGIDANINKIADSHQIQALKKDGLVLCSDKDPLDVCSFNEVIISPGINPSHPIIQKAYCLQIPVLGEAELSLRGLAGHRAVAVTGTNGKTTVTLLVQHVLNYSGHKAIALGNIGLPFSTAIDSLEPGEIIVAELSSFQLETMKSKVFDAAALLNISPDHLDRYQDINQYAIAKCRLQGCLKEGAPFYVSDQVSTDFGNFLKDEFISFGDTPVSSLWSDGLVIKEEVIEDSFVLSQRGYLAKHDTMNALAAWGLCKTLGISSQQFVEAFSTFKKPSHRIEFVGNIDGVSFYDDSKGTNIDAVIHAVIALQGPIILLAGGVDKGASYMLWKESFKGRVKELVVFGQAAEKIRQELGPFFKVTQVASLPEAVDLAASLAAVGDIVLLSPGCSSFDMFRDYAHRGEEFQKCVNHLEERSKQI